MKNVLVTGGTGYIGSHTVVALHNAGYCPIIIDDLSNSDLGVQKGINEILGEEIYCHIHDIRDDEWKNEVGKIDAIIHFAAHKSVPKSVGNPLEYYSNNVGGMIAILEYAKQKKIPIIFSSSCAVYGDPDDGRVTESTPLKPAVSPYGNTKRVCEEILRDACWAYGITGISLRYFNPIGAHPTGIIGELPLGEPGNLVPRITNALILGEPVTVFGNDYPTSDGTCIRDYIYVMDLAKAHVLALNYAFKNPGMYDVFNVGTGKGTSVKELLDAFEIATDQKIDVVIKDRRPGDVTEVYADPEKIKRVLGWEPQFDVVFSLQTAWNWSLKLRKQILP